ncbi:MAG: hypothetical protein M4579_002153 [Chaenotheca gracillima]|nr:MAG: hypothetical protein M4579_002153 [Chaenotheca gracillima]
MDISSLLNPQSRHLRRDVGVSSSASSKHKSRRSSSNQGGGSQDVTEGQSLRDDKPSRHRSHYQEAQEVNGGTRTTKGQRHLARQATSPHTFPDPLTPTSPNFDTNHHRTVSRAGGPSGLNTIRSSPKVTQEDYQAYTPSTLDFYSRDLEGRSRPSSASSASITTLHLGGYASPGSTSSYGYLDSTLSPFISGYTTSRTEPLAAFASVAIEDRLRSGYEVSGLPHSTDESHSSSTSYRSVNHPGYADRTPDQMPESDPGSPSPVSSGASLGSERPSGGSDAEYLRRVKGKGSHRQSFGSDTPSENSEIMRIPTLLGNPPRSLPLPNQNPGLDFLSEDAGPRCSYTENCTTGSPLRKVVSHIFGRNKLCTRQIPKGVWVHYCRKHYQRSRYRNPKGFALLQCDLVRKQVDRLQQWGGVADWIVKVRKREEVRLNKENAELAAGRLHNGDEDDDLDVIPVRNNNNYNSSNNNNINSNNNNNNAPGTSGSSRWLVRRTGSGKSTAEVLDILNRIEQEIAETGSNFPDVEILPNVVAEMARPSSSGSTLSRGRVYNNNNNGLQSSPEFVTNRAELSGGAYDLDPRHRAAMEAERKRKASMGNINRSIQMAETAERQVRPRQRGLTAPSLSAGYVKRQRTRPLSESDDYDDVEEDVPETQLTRGVGPAESPQQRRATSVRQDLPERVRSSTTSGPRPFLPSFSSQEAGWKSYGSSRGPSSPYGTSPGHFQHSDR